MAEAINLRQALSEAKQATSEAQIQLQLQHAKDELNQHQIQLKRAKAELNQRALEAIDTPQALSEAKQAIAELNQRKSMLEAQLLALTSSTSWRLTEPLRRLAGKGSLRTRRNLRRAMKAAWKSGVCVAGSIAWSLSFVVVPGIPASTDDESLEMAA